MASAGAPEQARARVEPWWNGGVSPPFRLLLIGLLLLLPRLLRAAPNPEAVEARNEEGLAALAAGRAMEAVEHFQKALDGLSDNRTLKRNLAAALAALADQRREERRPAEAVDLLDRAVTLHPERLRYRLLRGRARYEAGRSNDRLFARDDFAYVLAHDPDNLDALVNLGQLSYLERRLQEAVELWSRASALRPDDAELRARLARAARELDVEGSYAELAGAHFLVRHGAAVPRAVAASVLGQCETAHGDLCARFQHWPDTRTVVTLYTPAEFSSATRLHAWVAGLSDGTIRLTVRPEADTAELGTTIRHEYAHHLIRAIAARVPPWLHEGLAQIAEGRSPGAADARLRSFPVEDLAADLSGQVLGQGDARLVSRFYDAALSFTSHLEQKGGMRGILDLLRRLGEGEAEDSALHAVYGRGWGALVAGWYDRLRVR